ncbi:hypothetical protein E2553_36035 [Paraburkholderia dipogonis]|uniref:DNA-binding protein H-NS-like C-terminal domain-containing protein n=1 Tax=Paraburkholderia dipogonis TaxID=1211383 RepID=A0A4Y8MXB8_9BURK|nr:H-NS family nucleoid-associated regulatory protein [Paraburkholderia dipogonis]TFE42025.1 hypothetical protein E2553_36035 [Paraburkholderia dipogonis]
MATLESIRAQITKLEAQAAAVAAKQSSGILDKIRDLMEKHGLVIADIEAHSGKKRGRKPGVQATDAQRVVAAKYRDPKTGATWSGHGRAPAWIASAKDRTRFEVAAGSGAPTPKAKATAKAGNYVRGPQPALYRDPKSGATWSGRGRAPAWIANAKDRAKFLIAGAADSNIASVATEKAPAKKAGVKKAARKTTTKSASVEKKVARSAPLAKKVASKAPPAKKAPSKSVRSKGVVARKAETATTPSVAASNEANDSVSAPSGE